MFELAQFATLRLFLLLCFDYAVDQALRKVVQQVLLHFRPQSLLLRLFRVEVLLLELRVGRGIEQGVDKRFPLLLGSQRRLRLFG